MNLKIDENNGNILKILHFFVTEEDYKPIIINGLENEIWLENMEKDLKLIRISTNRILNYEQLNHDTNKAVYIMNSIKKNTFSLKMTMLNILMSTDDTIDVKGNIKNVETIKVSKIIDFKKNKFINEFFPKIKKFKINDKTDTLEFFRLTDEMNKDTLKKEKKLEKIFNNREPRITYILIVLNVVMFLAQFILNINLIEYFGNNYLYVQQGEWYRLFTSMFLHGGFMHIAFNMYALYILGPQVERYYGGKKYLLIYIISGLLGSLFSCAFMQNGYFSVGASGALFGLLGSIAYFTYYYRSTLQSLIRSQVTSVILINLSLGYFIKNIDLSAHIGGLIGGVLISMAIGLGDKYRKNDQVNGLIVLIALLFFMFYFVSVK